MPTLNPVVVAVDGSQPDAAAIRYGAHEARRSSRPLLIVHVVPEFVIAAISPMALPVSVPELQAIGRDVLDEAVKVAHTVLPASMVSTKLLLGQVIPSLIEVASDAHLLVLGDDRTSLVERIAVGSVITAVAAHAAVGVVTVPSHWTEDDSDTHRRRILLGVKEYDAVPAEVLRTALALAHEQRAILELVHVWDLPGIYGEVVTTMLDLPGWKAMVDRSLRIDLEAVHSEFPDVVVETSAWLGQPAHVLRERSAEVDLMLLTRKAHAFPFGHFGGTGRALLRASACPVEVLPIAETASSRADELHPEPAVR